MNIEKIKQVIETALCATSGLRSLQLQNHIYGCFVIAEDIGQGTSIYEAPNLSHGTFVCNVEELFLQIGIRYGFIMDRNLILSEDLSEYCRAWLDLFQYTPFDVKKVDELEDAVIEIIKRVVKKEEAFFLQALETGILNQEWVDRALSMLESGSRIVMAQIEKVSSHRRLSRTQRASKAVKNVERLPEKKFGQTHRAKV